jgi:hypothetical protein
MPQSYLIFDFGGNEPAAQQARHKVEAWKQAFRLGEKLELRFERREPEKKNGPEQIRLLVRLDFSDHEKLSFQRWVDRIPTEVPFREAEHQIVRANDTEFEKTVELFDSLAGAPPPTKAR